MMTVLMAMMTTRLVIADGDDCDDFENGGDGDDDGDDCRPIVIPETLPDQHLARQGARLRIGGARRVCITQARWNTIYFIRNHFGSSCFGIRLAGGRIAMPSRCGVPNGWSTN